MPHIIIKLMTGRDEETKRKMAVKLAETLSKDFDIDKGSISVAVTDIPREEWKESVFDIELNDDNDELYIKPGYKM